MKDEDKRRKELQWQKEQTTQYNLRIMNVTGIPEALQKAATKTGETTPQYIKAAIVQRLQKDGFLPKGRIVLNLNIERHKEKLKKLEAYLEQEKKKI